MREAIASTPSTAHAPAGLEAWLGVPPSADLAERLEQFVTRVALAPVPSAVRPALAQELLSAIDEDAFRALPEPLRRRVVEAVLELGYPWALSLPAEALELRRPARGTGRRARRLLVLALLGALVTGLGGAVLLSRGGREVVLEPAPEDPRREAFKVEFAAQRSEVERAHRELERLSHQQRWKDVAVVATACLRVESAELTCLAHLGAAHARLGSAVDAKTRLWEARDHEEQARQAYLRYLSLAPRDDVQGRNIESALRASGLQLPTSAASEAEAERVAIARGRTCFYTSTPVADCVARLAEAFEARAKRTLHRDDRALASSWRSRADQARSAPR